MTTRYALYFAPAPGSAWARFGEEWFARDRAWLDEPRRYGFHATLKAPFRLRAGIKPSALITALEAFVRPRQAFSLPAMRVARIAGFVALIPAAPEPRLARLAEDCVRYFDEYRAPLDAAELDRRRRARLSAREEALLARWGYPYVMDAFRFHMTLTGAVGSDEPIEVPSLPAEPLWIDAVTLFEESGPDAPFRAVHRAPFVGAGRLVVVVGASGSGKDAVIQWASERAGAHVNFAQRTITRAVQPGGEPHRAVDEREFAAMLARGEFALHWRANGNLYGIGREIRRWLDDGRTVVVNGSREALPQAAALFPQIEVVHLTAPEPLRRARLESRAREHGLAIEARLARRPPMTAAALEIGNAGELASAGASLLDLLAPGGGNRAL